MGSLAIYMFVPPFLGKILDKDTSRYGKLEFNTLERFGLKEMAPRRM
jgi:hypothetical protein